MDEPNMEERITKLDNAVTETLTHALGSYWTSTALACALLDKGVIEKADLLRIVDSLMITASASALMGGVDPAMMTWSLERFRLDLEQMSLRPGQVVSELQQLEQQSGLEAARFLQARDQRPGSDEDPSSSLPE